MIDRLADGCCSAVSPCAHQKKDPTTICPICQESRDRYRQHTEKQATDRAIGILRARGYTVIEPGANG